MKTSKKGGVKERDGLGRYIALAIGAPMVVLSPRKKLLESMTFPTNMTVSVIEDDPGSPPDTISLAVELRRCDDADGREGAGSQTTTRVSRIHHEHVESEALFVECVYREVRNLWLHELDEFVRVNGRPVHEPHPEIHGNRRMWQPKKRKGRVTGTEVRENATYGRGVYEDLRKLANDSALKGVGR